MIKFTEVNKYYSNKNQIKTHALVNINLEVLTGEIFGIIGTSGAGKSTLLRLVNKLESADSGQVWLNGKLVQNLTGGELKSTRQETGMVFQHFNLLESYTVYENIIFPLRINNQLGKLSKDELAILVNPILALTGLTQYVDKYPSQLSGGQKQRVGIARSLITKPKVLLCDECTSSLDPETTSSILALLKQINTELGVTILLITHEMAVIKNICNKVAVMSHGRIVEQGEVLELFANGQHEITKKLLSTSLKDKLPAVILKNLNLNKAPEQTSFPVVQLTFINKSAAEPVLSTIMRGYNVNFNILQGEIETIKNNIVGRMIIQIEADDIEFDQIKTHFNEKDIKLEVLGYASKIYE